MKITLCLDFMCEKQINRWFYEPIEDKYRYPLSQNDEVPNFEIFIFDWNQKNERHEIKRWNIYEYCEKIDRTKNS